MFWSGVLQNALGGVATVIFTVLIGLIPWRRRGREINRLNDLMDTSTPGGMTDLVDAIRGEDPPSS